MELYGITQILQPRSQAQPPWLWVKNCTIDNNRVARDGLFKTFSMDVSNRRGGDGTANLGLGAIVIGRSDIQPPSPAAGMGDGDEYASADQVMLVADIINSNFKYNTGGSGAALAVLPGVSLVFLTIWSTRFESNRAFQSGGAIWHGKTVSGPPMVNLTVEAGSTFYDNFAERHGGAVSSALGILTLAVRNGSKIEYNTANAGNGGAVAVMDASASGTAGSISSSFLGTVYVESGGSISNNTANADLQLGAYGSGGAIFIDGPMGGGLIVSAATVEGNSAAAEGGFLATTAEIGLIQVLPDDDDAPGAGLDGIHITDGASLSHNTAVNDGGAVAAVGAIARVRLATNARMDWNRALTGRGGAISTQSLLRAINITNAQDGGAFAVGFAIASVRIALDAQVVGNVATLYRGGAIWAQGKPPPDISPENLLLAGLTSWVKTSAATRAQPPAGAALPTPPPPKRSTSVERVWHAIGELVIESGARLADNSALWGGGAVAGISGVFSFVLRGNASVTRNRAATADGGGALLVGDGPLDSFVCGPDALVSDNSAGTQGGVISLSNGPLKVAVIEASVLEQNQASRGGVLYASGGVGSLRIAHSSLRYNAAGTEGGVLATDGDVGRWVLEEARVYNNTALLSGGAFSVGGSITSALVLSGSFAANNTARQNGGFLAVAGSVRSLSVSAESAVSGNTARRGDGGGIWIGGDAPYIRVTGALCNFSSNTAGGEGGGLWVGGRVQLLSVSGGAAVQGNSAGMSGGFLLAGRGIDTVDVSQGARLQNNSARLTGGAISSSSDVGIVQVYGGATVMNCTAGRQGGFLAVLGSLQVLNITRGGVVRACTAEQGNGGAVEVAYKLGVFKLTAGGLMEFNRAGGSGGAAHVNGKLMRLEVSGGSRLDGNGAGGSGGAVWARSAAGAWVVRRNASLSDNGAGLDGGALALQYCTAADAASLGEEPFSLTLSGAARAVGNTAGRDGGLLFAGSGGAVGGASGCCFMRALRLAGGSLVANNTADGSGGVLRTEGVALLTVTSGSSIYGNSARTGSGGAINVVQLGSAYLSNNSSIRANRAWSGAGGAIWAGPVGLLAVGGGSQLSDNVAGTSGGALWTRSLSSLVVSGGSRVVGNTAADSGGAVWAASLASPPELPPADFEPPAAPPALPPPPPALSLGAVRRSVLQLPDLVIRLTNTNITLNQAPLASGGGIYVDTTSVIRVETLQRPSSPPAAMAAGGSAPRSAWPLPPSPSLRIEVRGGAVRNNSAGGGGAVSAAHGGGIFISSTAQAIPDAGLNADTSPPPPALLDSDGSASAADGADSSTLLDAAMEAAVIAAAQASGDDNVSSLVPPSSTAPTTAPRVSGSLPGVCSITSDETIWSGNSVAAGLGGAIHASGCSLAVRGGALSRNTAGIGGGAAAVVCPRPGDGLVALLLALLKAGRPAAEGDGGGAEAAQALLSAANLTERQVQAAAAAMAYLQPRTAITSGARLTANVARRGRGGALLIDLSRSAAVLLAPPAAAAAFAAAIAVASGGGTPLASADAATAAGRSAAAAALPLLALDDVILYGNRASIGGGAVAIAGGAGFDILTSGSDDDLLPDVFDTSGSEGSGQSSVAAAVAAMTSVLAVAAAVATANGTVVMSNTVFEGNAVTADAGPVAAAATKGLCGGGAVQLAGPFAVANLLSVTLHNNTAAAGLASPVPACGGGALHIGPKSSAALRASLVTGNVAAADGGGILCRNCSSLYVYGGSVSYCTSACGAGGGVALTEASRAALVAADLGHNTAASGGSVSAWAEPPQAASSSALSGDASALAALNRSAVSVVPRQGTWLLLDRCRLHDSRAAMPACELQTSLTPVQRYQGQGGGLLVGGQVAAALVQCDLSAGNDAAAPAGGVALAAALSCNATGGSEEAARALEAARAVLSEPQGLARELGALGAPLLAYRPGTLARLAALTRAATAPGGGACWPLALSDVALLSGNAVQGLAGTPGADNSTAGVGGWNRSEGSAVWSEDAFAPSLQVKCTAAGSTALAYLANATSAYKTNGTNAPSEDAGADAYAAALLSTGATSTSSASGSPPLPLLPPAAAAAPGGGTSGERPPPPPPPPAFGLSAQQEALGQGLTDCLLQQLSARAAVERPLADGGGSSASGGTTLPAYSQALTQMLMYLPPARLRLVGLSVLPAVATAAATAGSAGLKRTATTVVSADDAKLIAEGEGGAASTGLAAELLGTAAGGPSPTAVERLWIPLGDNLRLAVQLVNGAGQAVTEHSPLEVAISVEPTSRTQLLSSKPPAQRAESGAVQWEDLAIRGWPGPVTLRFSASSPGLHATAVRRVQGYTGRLCAACTPGHYIDSDFQCNPCPSVPQTVGLGLVAILFSMAVVLYTTFATYTESRGQGQTKEDVRAESVSEIITVIVVHLQYFIIVTRLNMNWPRIITNMQGALAMVTGAETYVAFSPACLYPESASDQQAAAQMLGALILPLTVVALSCLLWAIRYYVSNTAMLRRGSLGIPKRALRRLQWRGPVTGSGGKRSRRARLAAEILDNVTACEDEEEDLPPGLSSLAEGGGAHQDGDDGLVEIRGRALAKAVGLEPPRGSRLRSRGSLATGSGLTSRTSTILGRGIGSDISGLQNKAGSQRSSLQSRSSRPTPPSRASASGRTAAVGGKPSNGRVASSQPLPVAPLVPPPPAALPLLLPVRVPVPLAVSHTASRYQVPSAFALAPRAPSSDGTVSPRSVSWEATPEGTPRRAAVHPEPAPQVRAAAGATGQPIAEATEQPTGGNGAATSGGGSTRAAGEAGRIASTSPPEVEEWTHVASVGVVLAEEGSPRDKAGNGGGAGGDSGGGAVMATGSAAQDASGSSENPGGTFRPAAGAPSRAVKGGGGQSGPALPTAATAPAPVLPFSQSSKAGASHALLHTASAPAKTGLLGTAKSGPSHVLAEALHTTPDGPPPPDEEQGKEPRPSNGLRHRTSMVLAKARAVASAAVKPVSAPLQVTPSSALVHVDTAVSLPTQLLMVTLIAMFVLYPALAQVSLSVFSCYLIDDGQGKLGSFERATWPWGYWVRDMNQQCYSATHAAVWVPVGVVAVCVFCLGPPLASLVITFRRRRTLYEYHTVQTWGFLYKRYRPQYYWWASIQQLQTLTLVIVDVFGRALPVVQQALLLLVGFTAISLVSMACAPLRSRLLVVCEFLSLGVLSLTITLGLFSIDRQISDESDDTILGVCILVANCLLILFYAFALVRQGSERLRGMLRSAPVAACAARLRVAARRGCGARAGAWGCWALCEPERESGDEWCEEEDGAMTEDQGDPEGQDERAEEEEPLELVLKGASPRQQVDA
ncbi:hypothetical protein HYH03_011730 [Edaphochlamys debaryana]|uniref:Uncharacterized protein n=1 Tax=Edaphochlamys debaryana TaxID=47281 RepID=A0A835XU56_9CHLO|nr:hypothetical protein HYH03_011730 [Edaphochlamys debaryana]|eukprot:KAG2489780.1 hypothetical protein HYH03_011730 [Edaphochlamys debaryana]